MYSYAETHADSKLSRKMFVNVNTLIPFLARGVRFPPVPVRRRLGVYFFKEVEHQLSSACTIEASLKSLCGLNKHRGRTSIILAGHTSPTALEEEPFYRRITEGSPPSLSPALRSYALMQFRSDHHVVLY